MSRGLGVVAKLAFFVLVVVVGVFIFRRDSRRALSDRPAVPAPAVPPVEELPACADSVQGDIRAVMPWLEPKVERCAGSPTRATCSVETNARNGRKTAPVKDWDCSQRHVRDPERRQWVRPKAPAARAAQDREIAAWRAEVTAESERGARYLIEKMEQRQQTIGEPDPYPSLRVVGSSTE